MTNLLNTLDQLEAFLATHRLRLGSICFIFGLAAIIAGAGA